MSVLHISEITSWLQIAEIATFECWIKGDEKRIRIASSKYYKCWGRIASLIQSSITWFL